MVLGFFSFSKFLMYRDLDPENWPADGSLDLHALIRGLLQDGFEESEPIVSDDGNIDAVIQPIAMNHVVDADSSQRLREDGTLSSRGHQAPANRRRSRTSSRRQPLKVKRCFSSLKRWPLST